MQPAPADTTTCTQVTITQTDGTPVTFPCRPERLIVANANAAEMVIALGAADKIVGVTDSTLTVPYIMDKIPNATSIGNWQTPNVEQILALHPDAVITYSSYKPKNLDQLRPRTSRSSRLTAQACHAAIRCPGNRDTDRAVERGGSLRPDGRGHGRGGQHPGQDHSRWRLSEACTSSPIPITPRPRTGPGQTRCWSRRAGKILPGTLRPRP